MVGQLVIFWVCNGRLPRPAQAGECDRRGGLARSYGMEYFSGNENACRVADLIMNGSEH